MEKIIIDPITEEDIPDKVEWYNDEEVTRFLHYDEKFTVEKSLEWLANTKNDSRRYENIIKVLEGRHLRKIGVIGLFDIDLKNKKAGFYITIGNKQYWGKGFAKKATVEFLRHCFEKFDLQKIYLYTDVDHVVAQRLYEAVGFTKEGLLRRELLCKGRFIDRYYYGMFREEFFARYGE